MAMQALIHVNRAFNARVRELHLVDTTLRDAERGSVVMSKDQIARLKRRRDLLNSLISVVRVSCVLSFFFLAISWSEHLALLLLCLWPWLDECSIGCDWSDSAAANRTR